MRCGAILEDSMATYRAPEAALGFPTYKPRHGEAGRAYGHYHFGTNSTTLADADVVIMCKVPAGAVITGGLFIANDIDTNATETFDMDIGTSGDTDMFGNFGLQAGDQVSGIHVNPTTGIYLPLQGLLWTAGAAESGGPITQSTETYVQVTVVTAPATQAANSFFTLYVDYIMPVTTNA